MNEYKKVIFGPERTIREVIAIMFKAKEDGEPIDAVYNGYPLRTDSLTQDYIDYVEQEGKKRADKMIPDWIEKGKQLIFPERWQEWEKLVYINSANLYLGKTIEFVLEILEALENGVQIEETVKILNQQGNSGASIGLVRNNIFHFSSKGPEFFEASAIGELTPEDVETLEQKKVENKRLAEINSLDNTYKRSL